MAEQRSEDELVSDERLDELIAMAIGRDTKKCLLELRSRRATEDRCPHGVNPLDICERCD